MRRRHGKRHLIFFVILCCIVAWPLSIPAEQAEGRLLPRSLAVQQDADETESFQKSIDAVALQDESQSREIPIAELVLAAVRKNLAFLINQLSNQISYAGILNAKGVFDPVLGTAGNYDQAWATSLSEGVQVRNKTFNLSPSISGTLPLSTQYNVSWLNNRVLKHPVLSGFGVFNQDTLSAKLTQPLLKGAGPYIAQSPVYIAELAAQGSQETLIFQMESTIAQVEAAYWQLGLTQGREQVAKDSLERSYDLLRRNAQLMKLGLASALDLVIAKQGAATRETTLIQAMQARQDATEALIYLVYGKEASEKLLKNGPPGWKVVADARIPDMLTSVEMIEDIALLQRRDVRAAQRVVDQDNISLDVAKNALLPSINLTGTSNFGGQSGSWPGDFDDREFNVALAFTFPWGNSSARAQYDQTRYKRDQDQLNLDSAENTVRSQVRQAVRGVRMTRQAVEKALNAADLSAQYYEGTRKLLELGQTTSLILFQVQDQEEQAKLIALQTQVNLNNACTNYYLAIGEMIQKYFPQYTSASTWENLQEMISNG